MEIFFINHSLKVFMPKLREKIKGKLGERKGFDEIKDTLLSVIKDILESIKRSFLVNIELMCKVAGVGTVANYEYKKDDIPKEEDVEEEEESTKKLRAIMEKIIGKVKDRIISVLESKNLNTFQFEGGTDSIPGLSFISDLNFKVIITLQK